MFTKTKFNKYMKARRAALKEKGICVDCQDQPVKPPEPGKRPHVCCVDCLQARCDRERVRDKSLPLPFGSPMQL
jgi:hypothetical protein